jgi:hypothetical protein
MMVVHLDRLAPYQGTARAERPYGRRSWRIIIMRNEPQERQARPFADITSTAHGKKEIAVRL